MTIIYYCGQESLRRNGVALVVNKRIQNTVLGYKEKKCKKAKWLSEKALQTAKERREAKGKGGKTYPSECRDPKTRKEIKESLPQGTKRRPNLVCTYGEYPRT